MPETGALIGTPASMSARVEPQTEPIDEEPFDSSVSETIRTVYGKSSTDGIDRLERPLRERAVADVAALRPAHEARLPDRVGREVVVVQEPAVLLAGEVVDLLALLHRPEREQGHDLGLAAGEEPRPVRPRADAHLALDRADLLGRAAVRAPLLDRDLLADEVLVDGLGRALDVLARLRVLHRRLALGRRRADRERQLDGLLDPLVEEVALRRLELLRVLLGVRQLLEVGEELLPQGRFDGRQPRLLEDGGESGADLGALDDVVLGGRHRDRRRELRDELVHHGRRLAEAALGDRDANRVPVSLFELRRELDVDPLRLPDLLAQVLERLADRRGSPCVRARAPRGSSPRGSRPRPPRPSSARPSFRRR